MDTIKQYWHMWLWRDAVTKLITINFIMWVVVSCGVLFSPSPMAWVSLFAMPSGLHSLAKCPWTAVTYMFTQVDFMHLLVNMLWFMLFGQLFMQSQSGDRLVTLYVYGGLAGALTFMLCNSPQPYLIGSSCAVLAIVGASTVLMPKWSVNLLIIGRVQIIWIAVVAAIFFIVLSESIVQSYAHAAGLAVGICYALLRRERIDITSPVIKVLQLCRGAHIKTAKPVGRSRKTYGSDEEELDALLDKVRLYGYASLSSAQRQRLFDLSQKIKR